MSQNIFAAVVLAGDRGATDPLIVAAGVRAKALVPVGGKAMVLRVLDALAASEQVGRLTLCGPERAALEENKALFAGVSDDDFTWCAPGSGPCASAASALSTVPPDAPVLLTTGDHALLTPAMIDYFCLRAAASDCDAVVGLAAHASVAAKYPQLRRTVLRLRDGGYCGCNLFAFNTPRGRTVVDFWRRVEKQRKRPWRVAGVLGWMAVLKYLSGRLSLDEALHRLSRATGARIGAVIMPFAEVAIDVDSPEDWAFARRLVGE